MAMVTAAALLKAAVPQAAVPELHRAESAIAFWIHMLDETRMMLVYQAYFTADMNPEGVANIIRTLARRGLASVAKHGMRDTGSGIVFMAHFPSLKYT